MPRDPYPAFNHPDNGVTVSCEKRTVEFHHPGYTFPAVAFLVLPAHDQGTLHHETARLACALVADNRTDGFLSIDREGKQPVGADPDICLTLQKYFFQVPKDKAPGWKDIEGSAGYGDQALDLDYPIFPDFNSWWFEHLPIYWRRVSLPSLDTRERSPSKTRGDVQTRDKYTCRLSGHEGVSQTAHLIPQSLNEWCQSHGMRQFGDFRGQENALLLRNDLHHSFDANHFAFVPRNLTSSPVAGEEGATTVLVAHMIKTDCKRNIIKLYHDVQLQPLRGILIEFVYCRFALAVLDVVQERIESNQCRHLVRYNTSESIRETRKEVYSKSKSRDLSPTKSRNPNPTKAPKRNADDAGMSGDVRQEATRKRTYSETSDELYESSSLREEDDFLGRGRKRRRSSSSHWSSSQQSGSPDGSFSRSMTDDTSIDLQRDGCNNDVQKKAGIAVQQIRYKPGCSKLMRVEPRQRS